jgi:hypothetical protein
MRFRSKVKDSTQMSIQTKMRAVDQEATRVRRVKGRFRICLEKKKESNQMKSNKKNNNVFQKKNLN